MGEEGLFQKRINELLQRNEIYQLKSGIPFRDEIQLIVEENLSIVSKLHEEAQKEFPNKEIRENREIRFTRQTEKKFILEVLDWFVKWFGSAGENK